VGFFSKARIALFYGTEGVDGSSIHCFFGGVPFDMEVELTVDRHNGVERNNTSITRMLML
jgi:hypothetical protein